MRPRFGILTRVLSVVFILAGVGAAEAEIFSQASVFAQVTLIVLAIGYLIVGVGVWGEFLWAWWAGGALTGVVVVMTLVLNPKGFSLIWAAALVMFAISGVQGWRDASRTR